MGYSKNYNVLGGYVYYNSIPYPFCIAIKFTKFTKPVSTICAISPNPFGYIVVGSAGNNASNSSRLIRSFSNRSSAHL